MTNAGHNIEATLTLNLEPFQSNITSATELVSNLNQALNNMVGTSEKASLTQMKDDVGTISSEMKNLIASAEKVGSALTESLDVTKAEALVKSFNEIQVGAKQVADYMGTVNNELLKQVDMNNSIFNSQTASAEAQLKISNALGITNTELEREVTLRKEIKDLQSQLITEEQGEGITKGTVEKIQAKERELELEQLNKEMMAEVNAYLNEENLLQKAITDNIQYQNQKIAQSIDLEIAKNEALMASSNEVVAGYEKQGAEIQKEIEQLKILQNSIKNSKIQVSEMTMEFMKLVGASSEFLALEKQEEATIKLKTQQITQLIARESERLGMNRNIVTIIKEEMAEREAIAALTGDQTILLDEQATIMYSILDLITEIASLDEVDLDVQNEKIMLLKEQLSMYEAITGAERTSLSTRSGTYRSGNAKNKLDTSSYLMGRTGSMLATMFLFNEAMDVFEKTMDKVDASQQLTYFGQRLGMTQTQISNFANEVNNLQRVYKKIDMTSVAATAEEAAVKYGLQTSSLTKLAETYAVVGTAFKKEGRTQEDAILAVNDAMDGEFRRLKELGIKSDDLKNAGWSGDTSDKEGIMNALMTIMNERGFTQTAKDITSFSDALEVAKLQLADLLKKLFQIAEPTLTKALSVFIIMFDGVGRAIDYLLSVGDGLPKWLKDIIAWGTGGAIALGILTFATYKLVTGAMSAINSLKELGRTIKNVFNKINTTIESTKTKTEDTGTTTGGTTSTKNGGFKDNFKKVTGDLGTMARFFVDAMVGLFMAWALMQVGLRIVADIGNTYESMKESVDKGIEAMNKVGLYIVPIVAAVIGLNLALDSVKGLQVTWRGMVSTAGLLVEAMVGMSIVMGLLALGMVEIAGIGMLANAIGTSNIQSGVNAIYQVAPIVITIAVAIVALGVALSLPVIGEVATTFETKGMVEACAILCTAIVAVDVILLLLVPAILIIAGIGHHIPQEDVQAGVNEIYMIAPIVITIAGAILALGTILSIPVIGEIETICLGKGMVEACAILVEAIGLTALVIASLIPALTMISAIGSQFGKDTNVSSGISVINSTSSIIKPIVDALINFSQAFDIDSSMINVDLIKTNKDLLIKAIDESANVINELKVPIAKIVAIGAEVDLTQLQTGTTVLQTMGTAITSMKSAVEDITSTINTLQENPAMATSEGFSMVLDTLTADMQTIKNFLTSVIAMGFEGLDASGVATAVQSASTTITSIKSAVESVKNAIGVIQDTASQSGGALNGVKIWAEGSESSGEGTQSVLDGAFDTLYDALCSIQRFLTKASSLDFSSDASANGLAGITGMITALNQGISDLVTAVQGNIETLKTAGGDLAQAIATGANSKKSKIKQAGTDLATELKSGFTSKSSDLSTEAGKEAQRAVDAVNAKVPAMESAGGALGSALVRGFLLKSGIASPGHVARNTAQEMIYTLQNIYGAVSDINRAGGALGSALVSGYANPTLKTNMVGLRKSSISSDGGGLNINVPQSSKPQQGGDTINITISMPNSVFYGDGDMEERIKSVATNIFVDMNSPNPNTGN